MHRTPVTTTLPEAMKSLTFIVLASLALGGFSVTSSHASNQRRAHELCLNAVSVNSSTITLNGHDIQRTTFECPDDSLSASLDDSPVSKRSTIFIPKLSHRSAAECRTTAPECQCGQPTVCTCASMTPDAPTGNDCSILIDSLKVIPQVEGATFVVQPRTFQLLQFRSCAIEWSNLGTGSRPSALEYCWDEMVALTGLTNQVCLEAGISSGASCTPSDGLWNLQLFRVSS